jgi:hypothetical protein
LFTVGNYEVGNYKVGDLSPKGFEQYNKPTVVTVVFVMVLYTVGFSFPSVKAYGLKEGSIILVLFSGATVRYF